MIFGDPEFIALESEVLKYYPGTYPKALGFFVIYIGGQGYGRRKPDATMLGSASGGVERRLAQRGWHLCGFESASAEEIAVAVNRVLYYDEKQELSYWGLDESAFHANLHQKELLWAPDGEEGFDDGSHVIQLDVGSRVRVIGFKLADGDYDPKSLRDLWMDADDFYKILADWLAAFRANWALAMSYEFHELESSAPTKLAEE